MFKQWISQVYKYFVLNNKPDIQVRHENIAFILTVSALGVCPNSLQALLAIVTASLDRCIAK